MHKYSFSSNVNMITSQTTMKITEDHMIDGNSTVYTMNSTGMLNPYRLKFFSKIAKSILSRRYGTNIIKKTMEEHQIVPDVISVAPIEIAKVNYAGGIAVNQGNELKPRQVKDIPEVQWDADTGTFYTLCMTDPDAPSRKDATYREWHHWLVGNIPGSKIVDGETLSEYIGSGPPQGTGLHRYVFLIYKQNGKLSFDEKRLTNRSGDNRGCFKISKFAEKYNLGNPIAGNFYQAEWDDYVPILYKQLEG